MQLSTKYFPKILQDNEMIYFAYLEAVIDSVDELSTLEIIKNTDSYNFRLAPSLPKYTEMLIEELLKFHNLLGIELIFSKSIKTSSTIFFKINQQL